MKSTGGQGNHQRKTNKRASSRLSMHRLSARLTPLPLDQNPEERSPKSPNMNNETTGITPRQELSQIRLQLLEVCLSRDKQQNSAPAASNSSSSTSPNNSSLSHSLSLQKKLLQRYFAVAQRCSRELPSTRVLTNKDFEFICILLSVNPLQISLSLLNIVVNDLHTHLLAASGDFSHFVSFFRVLHRHMLQGAASSDSLPSISLLLFMHHLIFLHSNSRSSAATNASAKSSSQRQSLHAAAAASLDHSASSSSSTTEASSPLDSILIHNSLINFVLDVVERITSSPSKESHSTLHTDHKNSDASRKHSTTTEHIVNQSIVPQTRTLLDAPLPASPRFSSKYSPHLAADRTTDSKSARRNLLRNADNSRLSRSASVASLPSPLSSSARSRRARPLSIGPDLEKHTPFLLAPPLTTTPSARDKSRSKRAYSSTTTPSTSSYSSTDEPASPLSSRLNIPSHRDAPVPPLKLTESNTSTMDASFTRSRRRAKQANSNINLENLKLSMDTLRTLNSNAANGHASSHGAGTSSVVSSGRSALYSHLDHTPKGKGSSAAIGGLSQRSTSPPHDMDKSPSSYGLAYDPQDLNHPHHDPSKISATEVMRSLAAKLGELHISSELTHLITVRRQIDLKLQGPSSGSHNSHLESTDPLDTTPSSFDYQKLLIEQIKNPRATITSHFINYITNNAIPQSDIALFIALRILLYCSKDTQARRSSRSFVNPLLRHLYSLSLPPQNVFQEKSSRIIFKLLSLLSNDVESKYFNILKSSIVGDDGGYTRSTSINQTAIKKLDLFLWRWRSATDFYVKQQNLKLVNVHLLSLCKYLECSTSRVQASQFCTVCLESFLSIQNMCQENSYKDYPTCYTVFYLMRIYHFLIVCPEKHPLLLEFCFLNLIKNHTIWTWMKSYTKWILNFQTEQMWQQYHRHAMDGTVDFSRSHGTPLPGSNDPILYPSLEEIQQSVVRYYQSLVELYNSCCEYSLINNNEESNSFSRKMTFLMHPVRGVVLRYLTSSVDTTNRKTHQEILILIRRIFSMGSTFSETVSYSSTYIRYHFMNFVELYTNGDFDDTTCLLCQLHLDILLILSRHKTPHIAERFHSLQVVQFLTKEVDLEYQRSQATGGFTFSSQNVHANADSSRPASSIGEESLSQHEEMLSQDITEDEVTEDVFSEETLSEESNDTDLTSIDEDREPEFDVPSLSLGKLNMGSNEESKAPIKQQKSSSARPQKWASPAKKNTKTPLDEAADSGEDDEAVNIPQLKIRSSSHMQIKSSRSTSRSTGRQRSSKTPRIFQSDERGGSYVINQARFSSRSLPSDYDESTDSSSEEEDMQPIIVNKRFSAPAKTIHRIDTQAISNQSSRDFYSPSTTYRSSIASTSAVSIALVNSATNRDGGLDSHRSASLSDEEATTISENTESEEVTEDEHSFVNSHEDDEESIPPLNLNPIGSSPRGPSASGHSEAAEFSIPPLQLKLGGANTSKLEKVEEPSPVIDKPPAKHEIISSLERPSSPGGASFASSEHSPGASLAPPVKNDEEEQFHSLFTQRPSTMTQMLQDNTDFERQRAKRKLYRNVQLHSTFLCLLMNLLLTDYETLDSRYTDQHPLLRGLPNIPFLLFHHLSDSRNADTVEALKKKVAELDSKGTGILFRILCPSAFDSSLYQEMDRRIGSGGFATIWEAKLDSKLHPSTVAVKLIELPKSIQDRCVWHDSFNELFIMEKHNNSPHICKMYDFGVDNSHLYIIMEQYQCSLRNWRLKQTYSLNENLPVYMRIFEKVLHCMRYLVKEHINHFDIKCDNIFLQPYPGVSLDEFYNQRTEDINFEVVLGDFGESHVYASAQDSYTVRHRGTLCIKSPEMLKIEMMSTTSKFYDRRKKVGAGKSSDIWSLGCLLFELLSGDYLFDAGDFGRFFQMLTNSEMNLLPQSSYQKIAYNSLMNDVITYILVRDPHRRPTIDDIITRFPYWMKPIPALSKLRKKSTEQEDTSPESFHLASKPKGNGTPLSKQSSFVNSSRVLGLLSSRDASVSLNFVPMLGNRIRLCTEDTVRQKELLYQHGITHVINLVQSKSEATMLTPYFENNFFFLIIEQVSMNDRSMDTQYRHAIRFMKNALKSNGNVLLYASGKNISRCIILLLLFMVNTYGLPTLDSYVALRKALPLTMPRDMLSNYISMVDESSSVWQLSRGVSEGTRFDYYELRSKLKAIETGTGGKDSEPKTEQTVYRCLCGACLWWCEENIENEDSMPATPRFSNSQTLLLLNEENIASEVSPLKEYSHFPEEMRVLYGLSDLYMGDDKQIKMKLVSQDQFGMMSNREFFVAHEGSSHVSHTWMVYTCRFCEFVTHCKKVSKSGSGLVHQSLASQQPGSRTKSSAGSSSRENIAVHCGCKFELTNYYMDYRRKSVK